MGSAGVIGKMDRPVVIYKVTGSVGDYGSAKDVTAKVKDVWAERIQGSGGEDFEEKVYTLDKRHYRIHYDSEIAALFQEQLIVEEEGRMYFVYSSEEEVRGQLVVLKAEFRE